ncbi:MAG: DUF3048 C-terminal domain-containing protein [Clostridia bacterium]|nr:DUF3048 C-terminal domain-containing protein [Clostridia bacterium]
MPEQNENNGQAPSNDLPANTVPQEPEPILHYNPYTGLVCDEESVSYRPISICIGNFDNKIQNGLSFADILIEAPVPSGETRLWALTTSWQQASLFSSVSSVRDYMMPISKSLHAISVFYGSNDRSQSTEADKGDCLDLSALSQSSGYWQEGTSIYASKECLEGAISAAGYSLTLQNPALPYLFCEPKASISPQGNPISTVKIRYGVGKEALFSYDKNTMTYQGKKNGEYYGINQEGTPLSFANVLVLFHNVTQYDSENDSYFTLDAEAGGSGYCYTGGGVIRITWQYENEQGLVFRMENGEKLTLNRGKTYISMMKVTESTGVIAK